MKTSEKKGIRGTGGSEMEEEQWLESRGAIELPPSDQRGQGQSSVVERT